MAENISGAAFSGDSNQGFQLASNSGHVDVSYHISQSAQEARPRPYSTVPFRRDKNFVYRDTLDEIYTRCTQPAARVALVGLGGVGKSQLAIEYSYRIRDKSPTTWVFWVHASSKARIEEGYRRIAEATRLPGRDDPKVNILQLVRAWLSNESNGRWVTIVDSADDSSTLVDLSGDILPESSNGSVLVTSRNREAAFELIGDDDNIIKVKPMSERNALGLFRTKLNSEDNEDELLDLLRHLNYMPLAISQAAAYVRQRAPLVTVSKYLEQFRRSEEDQKSLLKKAIRDRRRDPSASNSVLATWQISFDYIRAAQPSAATLLSLMSFFDPQGIPESLLRNRSQSEDNCESQNQLDRDKERESGEASREKSMLDFRKDDGFKEDVQVLRDYSFISIDTNQSFEMHALVQLAMREWLDANEQLELCKQQYVKILSTAFPSGDHKNWSRCQRLFPHVKSAITQLPKRKDSLNEWASVMYKAAEYVMRKGDAAEALYLSKMVLAVKKELFDQEHEETLDSMEMVGLAYISGGLWKEAEELQVGVMKARKRLLGEEHAATLNSMSNLASTYAKQGRWKEAEKLQVEVMKVRKRMLNEEHPETLTGMNNLAATYCGQERWKEAEELKIAAMKIMKRILGEEHPDTLSSMSNLARIYCDLERWKEAEELQVKVMRIVKRRMGDYHPSTLTSMNNLAVIWKAQGQKEEAIDLMSKCVDLQTRILGADHTLTMTSSEMFARWQRQDR